MKRIRIAELDSAELEAVAATLEAGGVVCFPTDTVYGLAVDPWNEAALERLFELKGRPSAKPILVLVDSIETAHRLSLPNPWLDRLAAAFWPGPLTLVTPSVESLPEKLTAGTGAVGLRWPDQELPIRIIRAFGGPITATSANRSGRPTARSADEAAAELEGVDVLIDGETPTGTQPSTVVDLTGSSPRLLREGRFPTSTLRSFLDRALQGSAPG